MSAYYNEIDEYAAQWLRNLIAAGLIAPGDVDTRSIVDVKPDDLTGYAQCHFFAGIGGWSLAARLAGWPDDRPIWTGSCPCQPFSVAGRRKGVEDERHLWPDFYRLIRASRPAVVMGEQVAGAPGYAWLDGVGADLEAEAYVWRAVDIPSCAVDAPNPRNRIYWMAHAASGWTWNRRHRQAIQGQIGAGRRAGFWDSFAVVQGKQRRRIECGTRPLAPRVSGYVAKLRPFGNAICPELAAEVIRAYMEATA